MTKPKSADVEERFWSKVDRRGPNECWEWTASKVWGYGLFTLYKGKGIRAHRMSYQLMVGELDKDLVIDHLCRNKACVNPAHLEQVSVRENTMRGNGPTSINAKKTHCSKGHEYLPGSYRILVYSERKMRDCKKCRKAHNKISQKRYKLRERRNISTITSFKALAGEK